MDEIELYRQMLTKDPGSQVFVYLAEAFLERKMYAEAIATCANGLRLHPHDLRARVILGLSYLKSGEPDRAEIELLKAREILEINTVTYQALAELYEMKGMTEKASLYKRSYEALHPRKGEEPETSMSSEPLVHPEAEQTREPDSEVATVTMAELYAQQGHLGKAAAVYRKILQTAPGTVGVEDRLAKLEKRISSIKKSSRLLSILEKLRSSIRERGASGHTRMSPNPPSLDTEKLAIFVAKLTEGTRAS